MPAICHYVCDECGFEVSTGWGSHVYAVNQQGERMICSHPGEADTVHKITGMSYFAAKEAGLCGVTRACTCVDCMSCFDLDLDRDERRCPNCGSLEVRTTGEMIDQPCPKCKFGHVREFDGGVTHKGMEAWARAQHPGFEDPEPWIRETIDRMVTFLDEDADPAEVTSRLPPDWQRTIAATSYDDVAYVSGKFLMWARFQVPPAFASDLGFNRVTPPMPEPVARAIFTQIDGLARMFTWTGKRFRYHPDLTTEQRDAASIYASTKWFPSIVA